MSKDHIVRAGLERPDARIVVVLVVVWGGRMTILMKMMMRVVVLGAVENLLLFLIHLISVEEIRGGRGKRHGRRLGRQGLLLFFDSNILSPPV